MIDLINKVFLEAGLKEIENPELKIFGYQKRKNYWLIVQYDGNDIEKIIENQVDIFIKAKAYVKDPTFDKNVNLLILNKVESLQNLNTDILLRIEENPYHLKKNILYYTDKEETNLIDVIGDSQVLAEIETMILDEKMFEAHKQNFDENNFESLVYRMAIKIPFIKINAKQANNLKSLEEINNKSLVQNQLNDLLLKDFFSLTEEDFNGATEEDVFEKLKEILPNENQ